MNASRVGAWLAANNFHFAVDDFLTKQVDGKELVEINTLDVLDEITTQGRTTQRKALLKAINVAATLPETPPTDRVEEQKTNSGINIATQATSSISSGTSFKQGDNVILGGLKADKYNGLRGTVTKVVTKNDVVRVGVRVSDKKVIAVRTTNVRHSPVAPDGPVAVAPQHNPPSVNNATTATSSSAFTFGPPQETLSTESNGNSPMFTFGPPNVNNTTGTDKKFVADHADETTTVSEEKTMAEAKTSTTKTKSREDSKQMVLKQFQKDIDIIWNHEYDAVLEDTPDQRLLVSVALGPFSDIDAALHRLTTVFITTRESKTGSHRNISLLKQLLERMMRLKDFCETHTIPHTSLRRQGLSMIHAAFKRLSLTPSDTRIPLELLHHGVANVYALAVGGTENVLQNIARQDNCNIRQDAGGTIRLNTASHQEQTNFLNRLSDSNVSTQIQRIQTLVGDGFEHDRTCNTGNHWIHSCFQKHPNRVQKRVSKDFFDFRLRREYHQNLDKKFIVQFTKLYNAMHAIAVHALACLEVQFNLRIGALTRYAEVDYVNFMEQAWGEESRSESYLTIHRYYSKNRYETVCEEHVDRGLITLIVAPCDSGLEVQQQGTNGIFSWKAVDERVFSDVRFTPVLLAGATLRRVLPGMPAALHRVRNVGKKPRGTLRTSIVFKLHANRNQRFVRLKSVESFVSKSVENDELEMKVKRVVEGSVGETVGEFLDVFDNNHGSVNYDRGTRYSPTAESDVTKKTNSLNDICQFVWTNMKRGEKDAQALVRSFKSDTLRGVCYRALVGDFVRNGPESSLWRTAGQLPSLFGQYIVDTLSTTYCVKPGHENKFATMVSLVSHLFGESQYGTHAPLRLCLAGIPVRQHSSASIPYASPPCFLSDNVFQKLICPPLIVLEEINLDKQQGLTAKCLEHLSATCPNLKVLSLNESFDIEWWTSGMNFDKLERLHLNRISTATCATIQRASKTKTMRFPQLKHLTMRFASEHFPSNILNSAPLLETLDLTCALASSDLYSYGNSRLGRVGRRKIYRLIDLPTLKSLSMAYFPGLLSKCSMLEHLVVPSFGERIQCGVLCRAAPNLLSLEIPRLVTKRGGYGDGIGSNYIGSNVFSSLHTLILHAFRDTIFDALEKGCMPKLVKLTLHRCRMKIKLEHMMNLVDHPSLETIQLFQSYHLYDSRTYSSPHYMPNCEWHSDQNGDCLTMDICDIHQCLRQHIPMCTIRVKDQGGDETFFKLKHDTKMRNVFRAYSQRKGVPITSLRFLIDGDRIDGAETPCSLELAMSHNMPGKIDNHHYGPDQIDCLMEQCGD